MVVRPFVVFGFVGSAPVPFLWGADFCYHIRAWKGEMGSCSNAFYSILGLCKGIPLAAQRDPIWDGPWAWARGGRRSPGEVLCSFATGAKGTLPLTWRVKNGVTPKFTLVNQQHELKSTVWSLHFHPRPHRTGRSRRGKNKNRFSQGSPGSGEHFFPQSRWVPRESGFQESQRSLLWEAKGQSPVWRLN